MLWIVTNEPQLAFENLRAPARGEAPTRVVHFTAPTRSPGRSTCIYEIGRNEQIAGSALIFSAEEQEATPQYSADADGRDELTAWRQGAAAASAQLGGGVA